MTEQRIDWATATMEECRAWCEANDTDSVSWSNYVSGLTVHLKDEYWTDDYLTAARMACAAAEVRLRSEQNG